jgi:dTMP kinase
MHYGPRLGVVGKLSEYLEDSPLRSRSGTGGYARPHDATVDVLLRLCREAYHHTHLYRPALAKHDVVVLDQGVYSKLAYALTVLTEQHPDRAEPELLDQIRACVAPWFVHPDRAFFLDVPWPLARERAILRGHGGGNPGSVERLLFLPRYTAAYQQVIAAHPQRVRRIHVGACGVDPVLAEIEDHLSVLLRTSLGAVDA